MSDNGPPNLIWTPQGKLPCFACHHRVDYHDFRNRNLLIAIFATRITAIHLSCLDHAYPAVRERADALLAALGFEPPELTELGVSSSLEPLETPVQPPDSCP